VRPARPGVAITSISMDPQTGDEALLTTAALADLRAHLELLQVPEDAFVATLLRGLQAKPPNFEMVIAVNEGKAGLEGVDPLDVEAGPNHRAVG
jgi:hypothetical protein